MTQMPQPTYARAYPAPHPAADIPPAFAAAVNAPPALSRTFIEAVFYLNMANGLFMTITGWGASFRFVGGGPTVIGGLIALAILLARRERIPLTLWFAGVMVISGHVSQMLVAGATPIVGEGVGPLVLWWSNLAAMSVIVRNDAARKRVVVYCALLVLVALKLGAVDLSMAARGGRLNFVDVVGGGFTNSNTLAFFAGLLAVDMLFRSLRCSKVVRPLFWLLAAVLSLVVVRTVSRSGILTFGCGLSLVAAAVLLGRGVRLSGLVLIVVGVVTGVFILSLASDSVDYLTERFGEESARTKVYSLETLDDLASTVVLGQGRRAYVTGAGINAHNSFIYTHMALGGITAYPYLVMLIVLSVRLTRLMLARDLPLDVRLWALAVFGMSLGDQMASNMGYMDPQSVYALAVVDWLTRSYSRRSIAERSAASGQMSATWPYPRALMAPAFR